MIYIYKMYTDFHQDSSLVQNQKKKGFIKGADKEFPSWKIWKGDISSFTDEGLMLTVMKSLHKTKFSCFPLSPNQQRSFFLKN